MQDKNPILQEMLSFEFNHQDQSWESVYTFEPSPELAAFLEGVPRDQAIYYDASSTLPDIRFMYVDKVTPGVRVKVPDSFVYLTLGETDRDSLSPSFAVHDQLLHYRLYYPKDTDLLEYWRSPADALNCSRDYIKPVARSRYLDSVIKNHCDPQTRSILEIGCNVGRNLAHLRSEYQVNGIEISETAVKLMRETYPQLADARIYVGDAKEILKSLPDNSFDLVFSMAVLMHIHPTVDDSFWRDIVRISRRHVITIENEISSSGRNWARNYAECFGYFGAPCTFCEFHDTDRHLLYGYITRVFDSSHA